MTQRTTSAVAQTAAAPPDIAAAHFLARLSFETDASDVHADLSSGDAGVVVVDARSRDAYLEEHIPGAINLPHREMNAQTTASWSRDRLYVTYCWGPGCNAATKGAARLAGLGLRVKELIGGIEYWKREGYTTE